MRTPVLYCLLAILDLASVAHAQEQQIARANACDVTPFPQLLLESLDQGTCRPGFSDYPVSDSQGDASHGPGASPSCQANSTVSHGVEGSTPWTQTSPCLRSKNDDRQYCVFSDSAFAENRGISVVTSPERAAYLARGAAFASPNATRGINQDLVRTGRVKYEVAPIAGKGLGVVATAPIDRGELIMANTASLMIDYCAFDDLAREEYVHLEAEAVRALPGLHSNRLLELSTHDGVNYTFPELVEKIAATNAFDIDPAPDEEAYYSHNIDNDNDDADAGADGGSSGSSKGHNEKSKKRQLRDFFVVFPEIARLNHDCRPNADYHFDHGTLAQHVHAVRPIQAGEEITISYVNPLTVRQGRAKKLARNWGFACGCAACNPAVGGLAASDERVREIRRLSAELRRYEAGSAGTPQMAELLVSLMEQEKLWGFLYQGYVRAAVEWNGVGEPWTASKYAWLAVEYGTYSAGPRHRDVVDMKLLIKDPWRHWSWLFRTGKRMGWGVGVGKGQRKGKGPRKEGT